MLIRPDQPPLFDSDVICAYLDDLHDGQKLVPESGELRWRALCLQAVAQALADTGIRLRWETVRRPKEFRYQPLAEGYRHKLMTTYDWLETNIGEHDPPTHWPYCHRNDSELAQVSRYGGFLRSST